MANQPEDQLVEYPERENSGIEADEVVIEYAGFWIRLLAFILDSILATLILIPILLMFYDVGELLDALVPSRLNELAEQVESLSNQAESLGITYYLISSGLPFLGFVLFWKYRAATPGKIWMDIYIVDANTFSQPAFGKLVLRYLGYYVSTLTLLLGFFWVAFDKRKQGFHDKIAGTLVVRKVTRAESETTSAEEPKPPQHEQADTSADNWKE